MNVLAFFAIMLTALALMPGAAHLFEMQAKMAMDQQAYFVVQQVYRGWALFGAVQIGAVVVHAVHAYMLRRQDGAFWCAIAAAALILASLAVFFTWTYPANQATNNWTMMPPDWQVLRGAWETGHAAGAGLVFLALAATVGAGLLQRRR